MPKKMNPDEQNNGLAAMVEDSQHLSRKDLIFKVCDLLYRDSKPITEASVLSIVGGSASTVHRYVKQWKDLHRLRDQAPEVPATFLQSLSDHFATLVGEAKNQAMVRERELAEELDALEAESDMYEAEIARRDERERELADENRALTARVNGMTADIDRQASELLEAQTINADLERQLQDLRSRMAETEAGAKRQEEALKQSHAKELDRLSEVFQRSEDRLFSQMGGLQDEIKLLKSTHGDDIERAVEKAVAAANVTLATVRDEHEKQIAALQKSHEDQVARLERELSSEKKAADLNLVKPLRIAGVVSHALGVDIDDLADDKRALKAVSKCLATMELNSEE